MAERELYQALRDTDPDLAKRLDKIFEEAREIWKYPHLLEMTEHGYAHIAQVETNLDALTRPLQASRTPLRGDPMDQREVGSCDLSSSPWATTKALGLGTSSARGRAG